MSWTIKVAISKMLTRTALLLVFFSKFYSANSEQVEVLLCYVPDSLNGEIVVHDGSYIDTMHTVLPGTQIFLKCNRGFGAAVKSAICLDNGHWSMEIGKCYRKRKIDLMTYSQCSDPLSPNSKSSLMTGNGQVFSYRRGPKFFLPGTKVRVTCEPGYQVRLGASESICQNNGNWSNCIGKCESTVDVKSLMDEVRAEMRRHRPQQVKIFSPFAAYPDEYMEGDIPKSLMTTQMGKQQLDMPPYSRSYCEESPSLPYGYVSDGSSDLGSQRKLMCFSGFTLMGMDSATCGESGKWELHGFCSKDCGPTHKIENGFVLSGTFNVGSSRRIECAPGYFLIGSDTITCRDDSQWTTAGTCNKKKLFLIAGSFNFEEANAACTGSGAKMATITSCDDHRTVKGLMLSVDAPVRNAWIGLRRVEDIDVNQWEWISDGHYLDKWHFQGWWPGYPDNKNANDNCVIYQAWEDFAVGWNDIPCDSRTWISSAIRIPYVSQDIGVVCEKNFI